ncbi:MAG TPA: diacylglycerol kinase family protein [Candidatus Paceibacterota bacterium]|mgnify:FL=1|nr:diacylglycerol kinase family protein [Candidatus Paceibacterota bacterium]HOQ15293.1 diacylglycerol kinase family protein [Candidatus Paceibacterota bacterium]
MKFSFKKIKKSFLDAYSGLKIAGRGQNFCLMMIIAFGVIFLGFYFGIQYYEWLIIILAIGLVLILEMINTVLEKTLDILEPNYSKKIKIIKDLMAGIVLIACILAVVLGLLIFAQYF